MKEQKKGKCKIPNSKGKMQSSGVTLIALIITIIILLILSVTSVALIMRWNIIKHTETASEEYQIASEKDAIGLAYEEWAWNDDENADLTVEEAKDVNGNSTTGWTVTFPSGNVYTVDDEGDIWEAVQVTVEGKEGEEESVTLTEENVDEYLGKEVTDFKTGGKDTEEVEVGEGEEEPKKVEVSTKYRLYYVDFEGKYGDKGAIYLKADCTGNNYALKLDPTSDADPNVKIKNLNPGLYNAEENAPSKDNDSMKAVTWLLDAKNWESLKEGINETYKDKVKYIVGAPSLEMMMDSYNTHYKLTGDSPKANAIANEDRPKLFYQYPYNGDEYRYGYGVGPYSNGSTGGANGTDGYYYFTSNNTVTTDSSIDSMYYPGSAKFYWLGSPSADHTTSIDDLMTVNSDHGGYITFNDYPKELAFCPLVCLDSSAQLSLKLGDRVPAE